MHFILLAIGIAALVFGPQIWARSVFKRYAQPSATIPGTGAELARHLLDRFEMENVKVEKTQPGGDHYDPANYAVRLSPENYEQRSLTAVAVAAHEVGHALQHRLADPRLTLRTRLVQVAQSLQKLASLSVVVLPIAMLLLKTPAAGALILLLGVLSMAAATVVHLITLPVELDASFSKALPILQEGYVSTDQLPAIRRILRAAAYTYVAASLASLLSIWRWLALLRR